MTTGDIVLAVGIGALAALVLGWVGAWAVNVWREHTIRREDESPLTVDDEKFLQVLMGESYVPPTRPPRK